MKLRGRLIVASEVSPNERNEMLQLMERHYDRVSVAAFEADLAEKQWIIQVFDKHDKLCGFSTQMVLDAIAGGRPIKALFSGDTIVDRQHWGDRALAHAGGQLAMSLMNTLPGVELYWFLISQGYKTYRFLPVFFREFYPRYDAPTPDSEQQVIDALATQKFGAKYDSTMGVVRSITYRLRQGVADVTDQRLEDPHIRFFIERNPGHAAGNELCCIARLTTSNFTEAANRVLHTE